MIEHKSLTPAVVALAKILTFLRTFVASFLHCAVKQFRVFNVAHDRQWMCVLGVANEVSFSIQCFSEAKCRVQINSAAAYFIFFNWNKLQKQVCLTLGWSSVVFALCSLKEKNTIIIMFIDGSSTYNVKPKNKNICQEFVKNICHLKILKIIKILKKIFLLGRLLNLR